MRHALFSVHHLNIFYSDSAVVLEMTVLRAHNSQYHTGNFR